MDIKYVLPENHGASIGAKHGALPLCEYAENDLGYGRSLCSYCKINLAYASLGDCEQGNLPFPDFLLLADSACHCMVKWFEALGRALNIPIVFFDMPFTGEMEASDELIEYMKVEFDENIRQLEQLTGKHFSINKFFEGMKYQSEASRNWVRVAKAVTKYEPSPIDGHDLFTYMGVCITGRAKKETAEFYEQLATEIEERGARGETTYKGEEKYRVLFEGICCWPYLSPISKAMREVGVNIVGSVYTEYTAMFYNDLDGLMRALLIGINKVPVKKAVEMRYAIMKRGRCDGILAHNNVSCQGWSGFLKPELEELVRLTEVPMVSYDGDHADPRAYSDEQFRTRLQALVEMMEENKKKEAARNV